MAVISCCPYYVWIHLQSIRNQCRVLLSRISWCILVCCSFGCFKSVKRARYFVCELWMIVLSFLGILLTVKSLRIQRCLRLPSLCVLAVAFKVCLIILSLDVDWINQFIKAWPNTTAVHQAQVDGIVVIWESQLLLWFLYACIPEFGVYGQIVWQDHHHVGDVLSIVVFSFIISMHLLVLTILKSVLRKIDCPYSV